MNSAGFFLLLLVNLYAKMFHPFTNNLYASIKRFPKRKREFYVVKGVKEETKINGIESFKWILVEMCFISRNI